MSEVNVIITFPSTHAALGAEDTVKKAGLPAKIIPTPAEISAGCGFALRFAPNMLGAVREALVGNLLGTAFYYVEKQGIWNEVVQFYPEAEAEKVCVL